MDPENENHIIDPRAPRPLHNPIFDEPCPIALASPITKQPLVAKTEGKKAGSADAAEESAGIPKDEDAKEPKEEDLLDTEGKSWDFMMSQM